MTSIMFSMFACTNWRIETIIAKAFEPGYDEWKAIRQAGKNIRSDQEKGG